MRIFLPLLVVGVLATSIILMLMGARLPFGVPVFGVVLVAIYFWTEWRFR